MPLPRVSISFADGALGIPPDNTDGLIVAVFEKTNGATYGTTEAKVLAWVTDFYAEAPTGTPVWLVVMSGAATQWVSGQSAVLIKALRDTGNTATAMFCMASTLTTANTIGTFLTELDTFLASYLDSDNAPCFGLIDFQAYTTGLPLLGGSWVRVAGYIGKNAAGISNVGAFAGRYASTPVYRNAGFVGDGPVNLKSGIPYQGATLVSAMTETSAINDARYNTLRTYNGKAGYYFVDALMLGPSTSDYSTITARRTIDKAYRIAFDTLTNYLLQEIPTTASGAITAQKAKAIESDLRAVFKRLMTDKGELSIDTAVDGDIGVKVQVDTAYNVLSNSRLKLTSLQVKPFGYARFIDVPLGFIPIQ